MIACREVEFMNVQSCWGFWHNLENFQTWGFCLQYLHYKPVLNHFCSKWGGGGVKFFRSLERWLWIARRKTLQIFFPITSKNSASGWIDCCTLSWTMHGYGRGLINYIDNKAKSRHLKNDLYGDFAGGVYQSYRLKIQSVMLVFQPSFVNGCPSNPPCGSTPPSLPCVKKYMYWIHL